MNIGDILKSRYIPEMVWQGVVRQPRDMDIPENREYSPGVIKIRGMVITNNNKNNNKNNNRPTSTRLAVD